jgi:hypothetical protein
MSRWRASVGRLADRSPDIDRREELSSLGVRTVLEKPFTSASLFEAVEKVLAERR